MQNYKKSLEEAGFKFHSNCSDEQSKTRFFGYHYLQKVYDGETIKDYPTGFAVFIDTSKDLKHVEIWCDKYVCEDADLICIEPPYPFTFEKLIENSLCCDKCRNIQEGYEFLQHANQGNKYCESCLSDGLNS